MNTEHIDIGLARYSDWAFTSSIIVLVADNDIGASLSGEGRDPVAIPRQAVTGAPIGDEIVDVEAP